ncbi:MAG: hypothetical protein Q7U02_13295 [Desulfosalsimonadaceae bacterium]|nr:hypothetical protein [Desulfosalsimonadaceae bacterium]
MNKIIDILERMEPEKALSEIAASLRKLLPLVDEGARIRFIMNLTGESGDDKVSSLVHL